MSLTQIIERKQAQASERLARSEKRQKIAEMFRSYVLEQIGELKEIFPYIVIGQEGRSAIVGVSYSSCRWTDGNYYMSIHTHNIELNCIEDAFNVGYGANSASGKKFKFDVGMKKSQLYKVFKQAFEYLVSNAYYSYADYYKQENKNPIVWQGNKAI